MIQYDTVYDMIYIYIYIHMYIYIYIPVHIIFYPHYVFFLINSSTASPLPCPGGPLIAGVTMEGPFGRFGGATNMEV